MTLFRAAHESGVDPRTDVGLDVPPQILSNRPENALDSVPWCGCLEIRSGGSTMDTTRTIRQRTDSTGFRGFGDAVKERR
jgi:hypothetical protein